MQGLDKLLHFLVSCSLVLLSYAVLSLLPAFRKHSFDAKLVISASLSFSVGLAKELANVTSQSWPWCPCTFDPMDLFVNVDGILTGLLVLIGIRLVQQRQERRRRRFVDDDPTEALTIEGEEGNEEDVEQQTKQESVIPNEVTVY